MLAASGKGAVHSVYDVGQGAERERGNIIISALLRGLLAAHANAFFARARICTALTEQLSKSVAKPASPSSFQHTHTPTTKFALQPPQPSNAPHPPAHTPVPTRTPTQHHTLSVSCTSVLF